MSELKPSFQIQYTGAGWSITCNLCGLTSHDPHDVRHKYCGNCRLWHGDYIAVKRLSPERNQSTGGERVAYIIPLILARARIVVGPPGAMHYDDGW